MVTSFDILVRQTCVALTFFAISMTVRRVIAQDDPVGYISIDCGSDTNMYPDPQTNLIWNNDRNYILTGKNGLLPYDNYGALRSFRYFPEGPLNKFCYELSMKSSNISFLLRAVFLHGNSSDLPLPIVFGLYVNSTLWEQIEYKEGDNVSDPSVIESIFFLPFGGEFGGNTTHVCLVPNQGTPFISLLELRPLDSENIMYSKSFDDLLSKNGSEATFFTLLERVNIVTRDHESTVRYPDDAYDRLWVPSYSANSKSFNSNPSSDTSPEINSVPGSVMADGWISENNSLTLQARPPEFSTSCYAIFYFQIDERNKNPFTQVTVTSDTELYDPFIVYNQNMTQGYFHTILLSNDKRLDFSADGSFILTAWEYYSQGNLTLNRTSHTQTDIINALKEKFGMNEWQGDPCYPVAYDWITCTGIYVESLTLFNLTNSSRLMDFQNMIPWGLLHIAITHSNIDDNIFNFLLEVFLNPPWVQTLNVSHNDITTLPNATVLHNYTSLLNVDLSHNQLQKVPPFASLTLSNTLMYMDISNNMMFGDFPNSSHFSNLTDLITLNLSNNQFGGPIPESLTLSNLPSLKNLDISHNKFSGDFDSALYFQSPIICLLDTLNADHNQITGVLNLTAWHPLFHPSFSFVNNTISNINPKAEYFKPIIELIVNSKNFTQSGILLAGNPYCQNAKSFTHRYFCRSSVRDPVPGYRKKHSRTFIIMGSVGGGNILLICCLVFSFIIWRLSRKVIMLKQIQHELANRRVQPPYFSYNDLKLATNHFHENNKLGRGSFGAVYKGTLTDGTIIAVKRLFNSKQKQVLDEFLNEVVLITGIKHKNLVQLKGCCIENQERILVYEFAEIGNMEDALWGEAIDMDLNWKTRFNICIGIARGLSYLHEELQPRIIHRDIKPANILLDKDFNPKIADFGLAKPLKLDATEDVHLTQIIAGTRGYFAPEYVLEGMLSTKADVFSFGILVLEIVSGKRHFDPSLPPDSNYIKAWAKKLEKSGTLLDLLEPKLKSSCTEPEVTRVISVALMCVRNEPEHRPTMSEVEAMLLEGKARTYDILSSAAHQEVNVPLGSIYNNLQDPIGSDTLPLLTSYEMETLGTSSSAMELDKRLLLNNHSMWSDFSSDTKENYSADIRSMRRSLSERIKR